MKALILAGGYSTRLGSLTDDLPKPMIEVGGQPVIERIVARLNLAGIDQILINVHYLKAKITEYIGDKALYYYTPKLLGHEGTAKSLETWLKGDEFLIINGDTLSDVDYQQMQKLHKQGTITALMDEWRCAGVWIYDESFFTGDTLPVYPYRPALNWFDIGTPERLEAARVYYSDISNKKP